MKAKWPKQIDDIVYQSMQLHRTHKFPNTDKLDLATDFQQEERSQQKPYKHPERTNSEQFRETYPRQTTPEKTKGKKDSTPETPETLKPQTEVN